MRVTNENPTVLSPEALGREAAGLDEYPRRQVDPRVDLQFTLGLCLFLAAMGTWLHRYISHPGHPVAVAWHQSIIHGVGAYPDQYRIASYWLAEVLTWSGLGVGQAHLLLRFLVTAASLFALDRFLRVWFPPAGAWLGVVMLGASLPISYLGYPEFTQPTDPLNLLVFILGLLALARGRDGALVPILIIGMLNRETAGVLAISYVLERYREQPVRVWLPRFAGMVVLILGIYVGLRLAYGLHQPYAPTSPRHYWEQNLRDVRAYVHPLLLFNVAWFFGVRRLKQKPRFLTRQLLLLPIFFVVYVSQGYLREARYWLPLAPILLGLTLAELFPTGRSTAGLPTAEQHPAV